MTIEEMLLEEEGYRAHVYKDSLGISTIGVGRNVDKLHGGPGITKEEALYLLRNDIAKVQKQLQRELPWIAQLDDVRRKVLIDMAFNLGIGGLLKFRNTLRAVKEQRWDDAAAGMVNSLWHRQVGLRARRLALMMKKGIDVAMSEVL
jgi:lysozyme